MADLQLPRIYGDKSWQDILDETIASIQKLCETKGDEYKASNDDQLANFRRRAGRFKGVSLELVWAVYAGKHWDAIETYINDLQTGTQRQRSEPIEGRIDDLIVYLILFKAMVAERSINNQGETYCADCNLNQPPFGCGRAHCPRISRAILCGVCRATKQEQIDECTRTEEGCQRIPF